MSDHFYKLISNNRIFNVSSEKNVAAFFITLRVSWYKTVKVHEIE